MVTELLVIALILSQLYICAITYAAFRKLEKYESAAMWIIEKWSQTKLVPTELVPTELVPTELVPTELVPTEQFNYFTGYWVCIQWCIQ
jgi:hypothetical protein